MTSDGTQDRTGSASAIAAALETWAAEPRLAAALRGGHGCYLVVSGDAARVLHASDAAAPLAASLTDDAGLVAGTLRLAGQIGRAGLASGAVSLVRLQLDPRRRALPVTGLLSRGRTGDGSPVLLLAFDKPVPVRPRRPPAAAGAEDAPATPRAAAPTAPEPAAPEQGLVPGARFVWRSDADGRFGDASGGASPTLRGVFAGQSWRSLGASGRLLDGQALLAALDARRTFRAIPVAVALTRPDRRASLDMSGAPLARAGRPFEGYGGFGLIRSVTEAPAAPRDQSADEDAPFPAASTVQASGPAGPAPEPSRSEPDAIEAADAAPSSAPAETPPPLPAAPSFTRPPATARSGPFRTFGDAQDAPDPPPGLEGRAQDLPVPAARGDVPAADVSPEAQASVSPGDAAVEPPSPPGGAAHPGTAPAREAFQAIWPVHDAPEASGRASRPDDAALAPAPDIAGDNVVPQGDDASFQAPSGPQAPFGATAGASTEDGPPLSVNEHAAFREIAKALGARFAGDEEEPAAGLRMAGGSVTPFPSRPAEAALLDGIPAALLLCRGETLIHANRRLLDLAGFPDLATLLAEGGLARLFRGLPPQRLAAPVTATVMATRHGGARDIEIERARIVWLGEPADCLLVRPRPEGEAGRGDAAALADTVVQGRAGDAEAALDDLDDAVVGLDRAGRLLSLNRAAAALFGCAPREVVGAGFAELFAPESGGAVRGAMQAAAAGACEVLVRRGGGTVPHLLSLAPMRDDGRRTGVLRAVPGTRHPASQEDRSASEAAAGETSDFAAGIGREIRAPVTDIVGLADLMLAERHGPLGDERYRATVRDIRLSGAQVLALVDDLVELSRLEAGRRELAFGPLALNDIVADCVVHLQPQAAGGRVLLRTSFAADLPAVVADEPSLRQAALAVIAGAIRDTAAGGQVIVSTTQAERGEVALRVRDTGAGTPDAAPAPTGPAAPRKDGATGLGLPLTRALVEANRGRFRVSSRKDEGTLVEMLFPVRGAALRA